MIRHTYSNTNNAVHAMTATDGDTGKAAINTGV